MFEKRARTKSLGILDSEIIFSTLKLSLMKPIVFEISIKRKKLIFVVTYRSPS